MIGRRWLLGTLPLAGRAAAQAVPIRLIVPFPPGGATDLVTRLVAARLAVTLARNVVVENRAGAGGTLGSEVVARSLPDGATLVVSNIASHGVGPAVYAHLPYDALRDFTHLALLAAIPSVLAVNARTPVRTLPEFIAWARREPGLRVASPGNGSSSHVIGELFKRLAGIELTHVPYRGSAPGFTDLLGGQVDAMITTLVEAGHTQATRLIAVTAAARVPDWPEVPTFAEDGFPAVVAATWFGLSGPAGLPDDVADRLHDAAVEALATPGITARLRELGSGTNRLDRAGFTAYVAAEVARWAAVVRVSGARVD